MHDAICELEYHDGNLLGRKISKFAASDISPATNEKFLAKDFKASSKSTPKFASDRPMIGQEVCMNVRSGETSVNSPLDNEPA